MKRRLLVLAGALLLVAGAMAVVVWVRTAPPPPPSPAELAALMARRDALQARFREQVLKAGEASLAKAPVAGVMIGIPSGLTRSLVGQIVTGLFRETTLTLKNLKIHKEGDVKTKLVFRKKRIGQFVLDVHIIEVQGLLKPGTPELTFGDNRIGLALPVELAQGGGKANLRFQWDSKGLAANAVCGDVDITREVEGKVKPESYRVSGSFGLGTEGESIALRPDFGEVAVRIFVDPSESAWQVVDGVVAEQRAGCRKALEKVDIKEILGRILGRGFNVKLPKKLFKPIRLPAGVRQSLELQGIRLDLTVKPTGLIVAKDRLWYGADLETRREPAVKKPSAPARTGS